MMALAAVALAKMGELGRIICPENQSRSHHNRCGNIEEKTQKDISLKSPIRADVLEQYQVLFECQYNLGQSDKVRGFTMVGREK